ncbi:flavin prenyltransferase UbiX [Capsulimonas corticalis]|uniref:Flavin prenyltransferase UbiX n=1 Tax=Capsulimonas corticalis TaxID=2219043 RepID=A0A402D6F1_9BACT|nr:UbiX family flavin prenyltransferase [Capsulimonas corticalis]BDI32478.1 flavin prenyltransferase UbiX [Capsulimonas corticalis]
MPNPKRLVVAVTGASGALYAIRFLQQASRHYDQIYLMLSDQAAMVFSTETGGSLSRPFTAAQYLGEEYADAPIQFLDSKDYYTPPASGSFVHDGMVIIPCSMGTLGRIASGVSNDLTTRSADVCLKERRKLILVARDTPFHLIHLRNMVTVTEAGAIVLPAVPAFYHRPKTVEDVVDTVVARVLQNLGVPQTLQPQWQAEDE